MFALLSLVLCLLLAYKIRQRSWNVKCGLDAWKAVRRSLVLGFTVATLLLLFCLGIARLAQGINAITVLFLLLSIGIAFVFLLDVSIGLTKNEIIDCLLVPSGLVVLCFIEVNGFIHLWHCLSPVILCLWVTGSVIAAVIIRTVFRFWART